MSEISFMDVIKLIGFWMIFVFLASLAWHLGKKLNEETETN